MLRWASVVEKSPTPPAAGTKNWQDGVGHSGEGVGRGGEGRGGGGDGGGGGGAHEAVADNGGVEREVVLY